MSTKLLADTGKALYGERWQSALARDIGITDRTMRRFVAGDYEPPRGIWLDLLRLTQDRAQDLDDVAERLKPMADQWGKKFGPDG